MCVGIKRIAPTFKFKPRDLIQIHIQKPVVLCTRPISAKCRFIVMNIYKMIFHVLLQFTGKMLLPTHL